MGRHHDSRDAAENELEDPIAKIRARCVVPLMNDEKVYRLGRQSQWDRLKEILSDVSKSSFAVKDPSTQIVIDDIRCLIGTSKNEQGQNALTKVVSSQDEKAGDVLEMLLAVGVDPSVIGVQDGRSLVHHCADSGNLKLANLLVRCRADISLHDKTGATALVLAKAKAAKADGPTDPETPRRGVICPSLTNLLEAIKEKGHPTLADLACSRDWFAVKNLLRRQAVSVSEFGTLRGGKTALEWAIQHKADNISKEITYYRARLVPRILDGFKRLDSLSASVASSNETVTATHEDFQEQLKNLDKAVLETGASVDEKLASLSETVANAKTLAQQKILSLEAELAEQKAATERVRQAVEALVGTEMRDIITKLQTIIQDFAEVQDQMTEVRKEQGNLTLKSKEMLIVAQGAMAGVCELSKSVKNLEKRSDKMQGQLEKQVALNRSVLNKARMDDEEVQMEEGDTYVEADDEGSDGESEADDDEEAKKTWKEAAAKALLEEPEIGNKTVVIDAGNDENGGQAGDDLDHDEDDFSDEVGKPVPVAGGLRYLMDPLGLLARLFGKGANK